ncbi:hypothetical protein DM860_004212 [Cuscuta australis]|uniref:Uncharacterized protein n=1 Tax=Cuscuta australis TaxID=267555 RepID=A0A328CXC6_9ASTE|nr:hypothetical protein DM860_004212 [Cuscuta australis]
MIGLFSSQGFSTRKRKKTTTTADDDDAKAAADGGKEMRRHKQSLVSFEELPEYMRDNEFIRNYYRCEWPLKQAFLSVFRWHNETLNIWTHLMGFVLFVILTVANSVRLPQLAGFMSPFIWNLAVGANNANMSSTNSKDIFQVGQNLQTDITSSSGPLTEAGGLDMYSTTWPFYVFLCGSMFCLLCSTICHTFSCHSRPMSLLLLQMDYVGISVMIVTSFFPPIYYVFWCSPHWQVLYLSGITTMGICTVITLLSPAFSTAKHRSFRAFLFMAMGLSGLVPAIHAVLVNWDDPRRNMTLAYEGAMGLFYITGTGFYICRVPERWRPGFFDLTGHSHQIFHVFVIIGAMAHYAAAQIFLEYRSRLDCDQIGG